MNLQPFILAVAGLLSLPVTALADAPQNYFGMGIDSTDFDTNPGELSMSGFNIRYGIWFPFDIFAVEIRIGAAAEGTNNLTGQPEARYAMGLGKVNIPFEKVSLYAMGGVSKVYYDLNGVETDESDIVGGAGIELLATEASGFTIEYLRYGIDDDPIDATLLTFGFNHRFGLPDFR
jgi:hypothetical protein